VTDLHLEVLPAGTPARTSGVPAHWSLDSTTPTELHSDVPWTLHPYHKADLIARDFARVVVASYLADLASAKPTTTLHRDLHVTVHVEEPDLWSQEAVVALCDLLHWLTGDTWTLTLVPAARSVSGTTTDPAGAADAIQLLSGGLDSLCGAIITLRNTGQRTMFFGHSDTSSAIRHAQKVIETALELPDQYYRFRLYPQPALPRRNRGPRSRSLMFMALGITAASATAANRVVVPENGFTSINPPLDPTRGGPLTTRSTHPWTFASLHRLLGLLGLAHISIENPYRAETKGSLIALATPELTSSRWQPAVASSLSCAKLDGHRFKGGSPTTNCGLCVACAVRRGAFAAAGIDDPSEYGINRLVGKQRQDLIHARRADIAALQHATTVGFEENDILASAVWPALTDFEEVVALCERGRRELELVQLV
jgi:7-cyano-7-deazaguanine synthase in queuosine biosynthesis